jgi:hypothetical protein
MLWIKIVWTIKRRLFLFRGQLLLNILAARQWNWQYLTSMDQRSWWRGNEQMRGQIGLPKPTEASEKWDEISPPRHESREVPCSRATYCRHDNNYGSQNFLFPHHFWRVPQLFLTSLMGIAYACGASFRQNPMSSGFNESDKGRTRRLFMFREFEKTAEKETPGVSFFVKLCLSGPKKYKIMPERTARPLRSRSTFHK